MMEEKQMLKVGQKVRFVGRPQEMGKHHPDFAQLLGQIGTVMDADIGYEVRFEGFYWTGAEDPYLPEVPRNWFVCWGDELEVVE